MCASATRAATRHARAALSRHTSPYPPRGHTTVHWGKDEGGSLSLSLSLTLVKSAREHPRTHRRACRARKRRDTRDSRARCVRSRGVPRCVFVPICFVFGKVFVPISFSCFFFGFFCLGFVYEFWSSFLRPAAHSAVKITHVPLDVFLSFFSLSRHARARAHTRETLSSMERAG